MKRTVIDARGDKFSLENFGHREYELEMTSEQEAQYSRLNAEASAESAKLAAQVERQAKREALLDRLLTEDEAKRNAGA